MPPRPVTTLWRRVELVGFAPTEVTYYLTGTVSPYIPGNYDSPPEGGEVELEIVERVDPITGETALVPDAEWDFTAEDMDGIGRQLADAVPTYEDFRDEDE